VTECFTAKFGKPEIIEASTVLNTVLPPGRRFSTSAFYTEVGGDILILMTTYDVIRKCHNASITIDYNWLFHNINRFVCQMLTRLTEIQDHKKLIDDSHHVLRSWHWLLKDSVHMNNHQITRNKWMLWRNPSEFCISFNQEKVDG
jgi:hypothetical protein